MILRLSELEHISGLAQGLEVSKTKCRAGLEPTISWLRVHALPHKLGQWSTTLSCPWSKHLHL